MSPPLTGTLNRIVFSFSLLTPSWWRRLKQSPEAAAENGLIVTERSDRELARAGDERGQSERALARAFLDAVWAGSIRR